MRKEIAGASLALAFGSEARMPVPAFQMPMLPAAPVQPCARTGDAFSSYLQVIVASITLTFNLGSFAAETSRVFWRKHWKWQLKIDSIFPLLVRVFRSCRSDIDVFIFLKKSPAVRGGPDGDPNQLLLSPPERAEPGIRMVLVNWFNWALTSTWVPKISTGLFKLLLLACNCFLLYNPVKLFVIVPLAHCDSALV